MASDPRLSDPERWLGGPRPPHPARPVAAVAPQGVPGIRGGLHTILRRVFGARPPTRHHGDADPGLFGPGSASWRVIGEPAAIAGGIRALLLQTLHPLAMAGVAGHSRYRDDPLGRLRRTSLYVTTSTFGTLDEVLEVARTVRRVHRPVQGTAPDGRRYAAADPRLLTWVSVALTSSFLAADRLWSPRPVTGADADAFVAEQSRFGALLDPDVDIDEIAADPGARTALQRGALQLPLLELLPGSVAELTAVLCGFEDDLAAGAQAREAVRFLSWPPLPPLLRVAYLWLFAGAAGSLPPDHRRMLGLPGGRLAGRLAVLHTSSAVTLLRASGGRSPAYRAAAARVAPAGT